MKVLTLENPGAEWDDFVKSRPEGLLFYASAYLGLVRETIDAGACHLIAVDNGRLRGVLPLLYRDGPLGRVVNSQPFYGGHGGILADGEAAWEALLQAYNQLSEQVAAANLVSNPFSAWEHHRVRHNRSDYRIGQFTALDGETPLIDRFHYKTRNMVRKAVKSDLTIGVDNAAWEALYDLHLANITALGGRPKPKHFFSSLATRFVPDRDYRIYLARAGGEIAAALLVFYHHQTVEYYTPAINVEYRSLQPNSLNIYTAMQDARERGFKLWNWGGTWPSQLNVHTFKKRWGSFEQPYHYYCQVNEPRIEQLSPAELQTMYPDFYLRPF